MSNYLLETHDGQNKPFNRQTYPYIKTFDSNCSQKINKYS